MICDNMKKQIKVILSFIFIWFFVLIPKFKLYIEIDNVFEESPVFRTFLPFADLQRRIYED